MTSRLLIVVNNPDFFLSHRLPIGLKALADGYEVHVASPDSPSVSILRQHGFIHHAIPLSRSGSKPLQELRSIVALVRLYKHVAPKIVHHVTIKPVLYGTLAARLSRVPAVVNAFSGLGFIFIQKGVAAAGRRAMVNLAYRLILRHPQQVAIFQNQDDRAKAHESKWIRPGESILIRGSGVDLNLFRADPEPEGAPLIVLPARMLWDKGVREFVEAAAMLKARGVAARFALVGAHDAGNPASATAEWLTKQQNDGVVEWWGYRADMHTVFAQSHVVCLPSYREGLPKALLEAAAAGRAIVTTDVPGCREVITHGQGGYLVPWGRSGELAEALQRLITDTPLRVRMGQANRVLAQAEYGIERIVTETLEVYDRLVGASASNSVKFKH